MAWESGFVKSLCMVGNALQNPCDVCTLCLIQRSELVSCSRQGYKWASVACGCSFQSVSDPWLTEVL